MALSKNVIGTAAIVGLGCAALAVTAVLASGILRAPQVAANPSSSSLSLAAPQVVAEIPKGLGGVGIGENVWNPTLFADAFRATHIARGTLLSCDYPTNNVTIRFQPTEYIKGTPLAQPVVELLTSNNSDLNFAVGQEILCAWIVREDGVMGLSHNVNSLTPGARGWNPQASVDMIQRIMGITEEAGSSVRVSMTGVAANDYFEAPMWAREAWLDVLVDSLGVPGSMAAYHAGLEIDKNPMFQGLLQPRHLDRIAEYALRSEAQTHDRGYHFILLRRYNHNTVSVSDVVKMIKTEPALVLIDHMSNYLVTQHDHVEIAQELIPLITNRETVAPEIRANALCAIGAMGLREALPAMRQLLGHETDDRCRTQLLTAFRNMPVKENFVPLANYLSGGDQSRPDGVQYDCFNDLNMHKRTLLAIARINNEESQYYIQQAYDRTRVLDLKHFLRALVNQEWHAVVQINELEKGPSLWELDAHYKRIGLYE